MNYRRNQAIARLGWADARQLWHPGLGRLRFDVTMVPEIAKAGETFPGMEYRSFRKIAEREGFECLLDDRSGGHVAVFGRREEGAVLTAAFTDARLDEATLRFRRIGAPTLCVAHSIGRDDEAPRVLVDRIYGENFGCGPFGYGAELDCTAGLRVKTVWIACLIGSPSPRWWMRDVEGRGYTHRSHAAEEVVLSYGERDISDGRRSVLDSDAAKVALSRIERLPSYWQETLDFGRHRSFHDIVTEDHASYAVHAKPRAAMVPDTLSNDAW